MSAKLVDSMHKARHHLRELLSALDDMIALAQSVPLSDIQEPLLVQGKCERVSSHAIERYRERTGSKQNDKKVLDAIHCQMSGSEEMELKPRFRVIEALNHGVHARYFRSRSGLFFVVESGCIVTVHKGEADRWIPMHQNGSVVK